MIKQLLIVAVVVYIALALYAYSSQRQLTYFPDNSPFERCAAFSADEQVVHEGVRMYVRGDSQRVLVVYHGNAGRACDRVYYEEFSSGRTLVLVEYPGFGGDSQPPSEERIKQAVLAVADYLDSRGAIDVAVIGESLGSSAAAYHSSIARVDKLVLIAPFSSLAAVAKHHYWYLPVALLIKEKHPVEEYLEGYAGEMLVVHGANDSVVPEKLSRNLPGERVVYEHAGHNDIFAHSRGDLKRFLE
jgi:uncharacterized protein